MDVKYNFNRTAKKRLSKYSTWSGGIGTMNKKASREPVITVLQEAFFVYACMEIKCLFHPFFVESVEFALQLHFIHPGFQIGGVDEITARDHITFFTLGERFVRQSGIQS